MSIRMVVDNQRASLRPATSADAPALHALISAHQDEGPTRARPVEAHPDLVLSCAQ